MEVLKNATLFGMEVVCSVHGPMKFRNPGYKYECPGWDQGDCGMYITGEELLDIVGIPPRPLERVTAGEFAVEVATFFPLGARITLYPAGTFAGKEEDD